MIDCKSSSYWFYLVRHCLVKTEVDCSDTGINIKGPINALLASWMLWFLARINPGVVLLAGKIWGALERYYALAAVVLNFNTMLQKYPGYR
jgi:hypothetical protein